MGVGSFGSFLDAARSQSRFSSQLYYRMEVMRATAKAIAGQEVGVTREEYPCYTLCQECHRLGPPHDTCPSCGERAAVDLRNFGYARSLQEIEEMERRTPPMWSKVIGTITMVVSFVGMVGLSFVGFGAMGGYGILLFFACLGLWLGLAISFGKWLRKPLARLLHPKETTTPLRWLKGDTSTMLEKDVQISEDGYLLSPLSKQLCRGYHTRVYLIDPEAMHEATWLLDEHICLPGAEAAMPDDDERPIRLSKFDLRLDQESREEFLRMRGLSHDEGHLVFYESTF